MLLFQQQGRKRKQTKVVILRKHRQEANDSPPAHNKADWRYRQMGSLGANGKDSAYQVHEMENRSGRVSKHATNWHLMSSASFFFSLFLSAHLFRCTKETTRSPHEQVRVSFFKSRVTLALALAAIWSISHVFHHSLSPCRKLNFWTNLCLSKNFCVCPRPIALQFNYSVENSTSGSLMRLSFPLKREPTNLLFIIIAQHRMIMIIRFKSMFDAKIYFCMTKG